MAIDEKLLKSVIAEVLKEMNTTDTSSAAAVRERLMNALVCRSLKSVTLKKVQILTKLF